MHEVLQVAQTISPIGVIFLLGIVIFQLVNGKDILARIRGTQVEKYPEIKDHITKMAELTQQNEVLLENHFKHEIPDMISSINRIEGKVDKITDQQVTQGLDIARLKALSEK